VTRRTGPSAAVRDEVYERAGYRCERCGDADGPFEVHHRRPRGMGGSRREDTNSPANLLLLCTRCHLWTESNRATALERGYLVPQGQDPATVPVIRECSPLREDCVDLTACAYCPRAER